MVFHLGKHLTSLAIEGETGTNLGGGRLKKKKLNCYSFNKTLLSVYYVPGTVRIKISRHSRGLRSGRRRR